MKQTAKILIGICIILFAALPASAYLVLYSYDDFGRLTYASYSDGYTWNQMSYSYDSTGNVTGSQITTQMQDSDGDGIPDGWETLYGLNPNNPSDAGTDSDGDGYTNLQEYLAGTDPRDSSSYPGSQAASVPALDWIGYCIAVLLVALFAFRNMRKKAGIFLFMAAFFFAIAGYVHSAAGPGWFDVQGRPVSPEEADAYRKKASALESGEITPNLATTITPEIAELARALKNDPFLIYEYVHNYIDYVPYYGSMKGATMTYLDGSGNDFDQASLLIALLRASGYSAQYVYGHMLIPAYGDAHQKDMQHWFGVDANEAVIMQALANGGIPGICLGYCLMERVWVQATISGGTYFFDPAFKVYQETSGIDLKAAMGYNRSALLSAAGGAVGIDYVQNLNETGLNSTLDGYTMTLVDNIRANHPNAKMEEVVGGRSIVPEHLTALPTTLDFNNTPQDYWTDIPDSYVHKVRIQHGEIDRTLNVPDLAGQRLSLTYRAGIGAMSAGGIPLEGTVSPMPVTSASSPEPVTISGGQLTAPQTEEGGTFTTQGYHGTVDFGNVAGSMYREWAITLSNPSGYPTLNVNSSLSNNTGGYSIVSNGGSCTVPAGSTLTIIVRFSAVGQSRGTKTATFNLDRWYSGYPHTNDTWDFTGFVAEYPNLTGSYGRNFGSAYIGNPVDGAVRLQDSGSLTLSITGVTLTGTDAGRFQITGGNQAGDLSSGQNRDIQVRYLADSIGSHSAAVRVAFTYDGLPYTVDLGLIGQTSSTPVAQLWLDDQLIAEETEPVIGTGLNTLTISATHPYAGLPVDQSVDYTLKRGSTYSIVYDFGGSRLGRLLEKRQRQLRYYRDSGLSDSSREVLTETLNVLGATWMRNTTLNQNLLAQVSGVLDVWHHRFGIVAQESGYYIDVKVQMSSSLSRHGDPQDTTVKEAYFKSLNHLDSAMEHGVLEQAQVDHPAASTVKLLSINNGNNARVFKADSSNYGSIRPQLSGYSENDLNAFQTRVNGGSILILPENGAITLGEWSGKGYIDYLPGNPSFVGMVIEGGYYGGYSAYQTLFDIPSFAQSVSLELAPLAVTPKIPSRDPVDMATGHFLSDNTDIVLTGGSTGGLTLKRSYNSSNNTVNGILGHGWTHNYNMYIETHSSPDIGLGTRLPVDAAALITASVATLDVMTGDTDLKSWMVGALIGKWGMDKLTGNAASVRLQTDVLTFIRLPDGSYGSPPGVTSRLVQNGGLFRVDERFGRTVHFNADKKVSSLSDADGNQTSFTYESGRLQSVSDSFGHTLTFAYAGNLLSSISDSAGRSVSYGYDGNADLVSYTDPEGKVWDYGYDGVHCLLTVRNPRAVTTVTNVYDSQGRVMTQTVPRQSGSVSYNLYFSGYRNIEEDALGSQTVYYFDEKRRLLSVIDALGNQVDKAYDGQNHVVSVTDQREHTTTFTYDGDNNLIITTDPYGKETHTTYDSLFRVTDITDPLGHTVHYDYDAKHHPIRTTTYRSVHRHPKDLLSERPSQYLHRRQRDRNRLHLRRVRQSCHEQHIDRPCRHLCL